MASSRTRLDDSQIADHLRSLEPGWAVQDGKLAKTFTFPSYASGVVFAAAVGHLADRLDHHPDLAIGYRRVIFAVNTHDAGGITEFDFELARRVDSI